MRFVVAIATTFHPVEGDLGLVVPLAVPRPDRRVGTPKCLRL
jgi:hypothetical protein